MSETRVQENKTHAFLYQSVMWCHDTAPHDSQYYTRLHAKCYHTSPQILLFNNETFLQSNTAAQRECS